MNTFCVVLADPRFAANIGFTARVCTNFGIQDFRGVTQDSKRWHWEEAQKIAVPPADRTLSSFQLYSSVDAAVRDCDFAVGFTRRTGEDRVAELTPSSLVELIRQSSSKKIALVFGNEETGLTEEELRPCSHLCKIPTAEAMPSMNLSHAVAVVLARLREDLIERGLSQSFSPQPAQAKIGELSGLFGHWRQFLMSSGMTQSGNPDRLLRRLERIFHRSRLSSREVKIIRGILAKALHRMKND